MLGQHVGYTPNVNVLNVAKFANVIEDKTLCPRIAERLQFAIAGIALQLVKHWIEHQFTVFNAAAGQPLDLHVEFAAQHVQQFFVHRLVAAGQQRRRHPIAPRQIIHSVLAQLRGHGQIKLVP